jgi:uncharacterized BrkB/YihY/UPF0761 family membrane protein
MADTDQGDESRAARRLAVVDTWARGVASERAATVKQQLERFQGRPVGAFVIRVWERDGVAAGNLLGSALAFRLFLFFLPLVLFVVGLVGVAASLIDAEMMIETASVSGALAAQVHSAFEQSNTAAWLAIASGLFGMATGGRALTRALLGASALAWQTPARRRATVRVIGTVVGLFVSLALMAALVGKVRAASGVAVTSLSLLGASAVYAVAWLLIAQALPRATTDPGANIPGAVLVGGSLAGLQGVTQLVLPGQISSASQLYGAIGSTIAILGWFFILGRVMVFSFVLNAVVFERLGSVSSFVFGLPVLRALPRRFAVVARFFDLDGG